MIEHSLSIFSLDNVNSLLLPNITYLVSVNTRLPRGYHHVIPNITYLVFCKKPTPLGLLPHLLSKYNLFGFCKYSTNPRVYY